MIPVNLSKEEFVQGTFRTQRGCTGGPGLEPPTGTLGAGASGPLSGYMDSSLGVCCRLCTPASCLGVQPAHQLVRGGDMEIYQWPHKNMQAFIKPFKRLCLLMKTAKFLCSWLGLFQLKVVTLVSPD